MRHHLIIYVKRPFPNHAKTRLGAAIGCEQSAGVYARLAYRLLNEIAVAGLHDTVLELAVATPDDCPYFESAFPEFLVRPQVDGDLGARMARSFDRAFGEGAGVAVLVGSDIPGLTASIIRDAFAALSVAQPDGITSGVVGPAADGGYYLIGMQAPGAPLFDDIAWSTPDVLAQTMALAQSHRVSLATLPELRDMDDVRDYEAWIGALKASRRRELRLTPDV